MGGECFGVGETKSTMGGRIATPGVSQRRRGGENDQGINNKSKARLFARSRDGREVMGNGK